MTIRRIVPLIEAADPAASRAFYVDVLGLEVAMDMGWIVTFASPSNATAQVSVMRGSGESAAQPDISIEVSDVDACHARAMSQGCTIVYPLTDEPWGVRRFFVREPNGRVINVLSHRTAE
jgi:catechol 2,3-dioxygenase-like lactoylglutathione lyase family enzyme